MISLVSVPKPFSGRLGIIQDNALGSWARLGSDCEIILFGDDCGVADAAMRHGARHEPYVARNEYGTPVLADVFARADAIAQNPVIGFVNADIILLGDFLSSIRATMQFRNRFLIVSSRL